MKSGNQGPNKPPPGGGGGGPNKGPQWKKSESKGQKPQQQQQQQQQQQKPQSHHAKDVKSSQQGGQRAQQAQQQPSGGQKSAWGNKPNAPQVPIQDSQATVSQPGSSQQPKAQQATQKSAWGPKAQPQAAASSPQQHQLPTSQKKPSPGSDASQQTTSHVPATSTPKDQQPSKGSKSKNKGATANISMFPQKPKRNQAGPGNPVRLITNLFRLCLKNNKDIYRHGVNVEEVDTSESPSKEGKVPRKLPKEIRVQAVRKAIQLYISNNSGNSIGGLKYLYVTDSNATIVFALFNMIDAPTGGDVSTKSTSILVDLMCDRIVDKKIQQAKRKFAVKFSDGSVLNIKELINFCQGQGSKEYSDFHDHIRAMNTILHGEIVGIPSLLVSQQKSSGVGSVFRLDEKEQFSISKGVYCNKGTTLSVRATESGLALNVANTVAPFYDPMPVIDFVINRYSTNYNRIDLKRGLSPDVCSAILKDLKNKQVEVLHINYGKPDKPHYKKYRIHDIRGSAKDKFKSGNVETTIEDYFAKEYPQHRLKYPLLPCIVDNGRSLPMELCRIVEKQRVTRKLEPDEVSNVIREAALKPERHFQEVKKNVNLVKAHTRPLSDFGIELDCTPIEVDGRELPPVELAVSQNKSIRALGGQYNIQRDRFVRPAQIKKWTICVIVDQQAAVKDGPNLMKNANRFAELYVEAGRSKGVNISQPSEVRFLPEKPPQTVSSMPESQVKQQLKTFFTYLNDNQFDFAVILIPNRPDWIYRYLQYLETCVDVRKKRKEGESCTRTSCIKYENFMKKIIYDRSNGIMFLSNLWLKHNVKLGGVNVVLKGGQNFGLNKLAVNFLNDGFLYISIDVCHPAPGDKFMQSVAAMVGMWDLTVPGISHSTRLRVQAKQRSKNDLSTVEEVGEVRMLFEDILSTYMKKKGKAPTHIVVLRDGVSEGQFKMVLQFELSKIKGVLSKKAPTAKMACMTVQKRHKTRFMRKEPFKTPKGDDYNIQPGTVVDSGVTHPNDFNFYLAPHKAIQGTARAPHIHMIYDDIGFDLDSAQALIHSLSYLSPRCTKGTSIPTPINLADLAAERGKNIIISWSDHNDVHRMGQDELLANLNAHLNNLGDANYKDTLYYV